MSSLTDMATTKFDCRFLKPKHLDIRRPQINDTIVWMTKIMGMIARPDNLAGLSCEASFVKTACR